jgi:hypothetical protein
MNRDKRKELNAALVAASAATRKVIASLGRLISSLEN